MNSIERAVQIAVTAHRDQVRKSDQTPYVAHPIMVGWMLHDAGFDEVVVVAGIVHDVLEDTAVTEDELRTELGDAVVAIVTAVSEDKTLPWEARKEQYIAEVANADESVQAVSVADKIHNAESLLYAHKVQGSAIWDAFSKPRSTKLWFERTLLEALQEKWQHPILDRYAQLVVELESLD